MFKARKKIKLATPAQLRGESARVYRAWLGGELDLDEAKGAVWMLDRICQMMRGPEVEHLLADIKGQWDEHQRAQKSNGHAEARH